MADQYYEGVGRRKESSARVRLHTGGTGNVLINDKDGTDYLNRSGDIEAALAPLRLVGVENVYNVTVHGEGGGVTGQTSAIQFGVARALLNVDPELRSQMRHAGFLTPNARVK